MGEGGGRGKEENGLTLRRAQAIAGRGGGAEACPEFIACTELVEVKGC